MRLDKASPKTITAAGQTPPALRSMRRSMHLQKPPDPNSLESPTGFIHVNTHAPFQTLLLIIYYI